MSAKRRNAWNDEKNDPTNGVMNDVKNRDFGVIRFGVIGDCDVHVLRASNF
jgi:hypothetical protein